MLKDLRSPYRKIYLNSTWRVQLNLWSNRNAINRSTLFKNSLDYTHCRGWVDFDNQVSEAGDMIPLHRYVPWVGFHPNKDLTSPVMSTTTLLESPDQKPILDPKFWKWSLFSFIPYFIKATNNFQFPTTVNKKLKKHSRSRGSIESAIQYSNIRFRPYVSKVPWHTGPRGFLSQLFPRYGHYCGPNWSSGKDNGSQIWDKRPIDWLDYCCYCHDMGYDTHDQAELLKADLAFLECLERPHTSLRGDPRVAYLYKFMCVSGLRSILIPYRQNLVKFQTGKLFLPSELLNKIKWKRWNFAKT